MGNNIFDILTAVAVFLVLFLIIMIIRKKLTGNNEHYDERQILVRGKGYKISFMTTILLNVFYAVFFYGPSKDIVSPQFVVITITFIGLAIYAIYCIFNDAYLQVGQKVGAWMAVLAFVIACNLIAFFVSSTKGFTEDGLATGSSLNLMMAVLFGAILVSFLIKRFMEKRGDSHEES
jgi:hypothetical protein